MPIVVDIDVMLARRKMAVGALAEQIAGGAGEDLGIDRFGGGAKRQSLQLTSAQQQHPALVGNGTRSISGAQVGRRGGTGPLPPAPHLN